MTEIMREHGLTFLTLEQQVVACRKYGMRLVGGKRGEVVHFDPKKRA